MNLAIHDGVKLNKIDNQLLKDKTQPLVNRALAGTYPPGSTFKIVTSSALLTQSPGTTINTDEFGGYKDLAHSGYVHVTVNHARGEYATKSGAGVNAIEGFWAMLKRGINGTHIHVLSKHLATYLGEFEYRWNMRQVPHLMLDRLMFSFVR